MLSRFRPSPAMVVACVALIVALGGAAYAATQLPKDSVGTRQLRNNAVKTRKLADRAVTGPKITPHTLAERQLAPPEGWHEVGSTGQPPFQNSWGNVPSSDVEYAASVAFYKDRQGVVHLRGVTKGGTPNTTIFRLPKGYRPGPGRILAFAVSCSCRVPLPGSQYAYPGTGRVFVFGPGIPAGEDGEVELASDGSEVSLDGITFRAAS